MIQKLRIEITATYDRPEPSFLHQELMRMKDAVQAALGGPHYPLRCFSHLRDSHIEVAPFTGAYVVTRSGKPVASYMDERLAQNFIDHDDHPELCEIHEVESA